MKKLIIILSLFFIPTIIFAATTVPLGKNGSVEYLLYSGDYLGIGTTSPYRALSVIGSSDLGTNALAGYFTATSTTASSTFLMASTTALSISKLYDTIHSPGSNGYVLKSTGTSTLWVSTSSLNISGGGGSTSPGGSNTDVQYNSSSSFAGSSNLTFDGNNLTIGDGLVTVDGQVGVSDSGAPNVLNITGGTGWASTDGGSSNGGGGFITLGNGGAGVGSGSTDGNGGNGGGFTLTGGTGGNASGSTDGNNGGVGGVLTLDSGNGGNVTGSAEAHQGGNGGAINMTAGNGGTDSGNLDGVGGNITITSGSSASGQVAGNITISGGSSDDGPGDGPSGNIVINGGTNTGGTSGDVDLTSGDAINLNGSTYLPTVGECDGPTSALATDGTNLIYCDTSLSDETLKTNINSLTASSSIASLLSLNPISFNWNSAFATSPQGIIENISTTSLQTGMLAQQVQNVLPNLVSTSYILTGYSATSSKPIHTQKLSVNYAGFVPYLISAFQGVYVRLASLFNGSGVPYVKCISMPDSATGGIDYYASVNHQLLATTSQACN